MPLVAGLLAACGDDPTGTVEEQPLEAVALLELAFTDIGLAHMSASVSVSSNPALAELTQAGTGDLIASDEGGGPSLGSEAGNVIASTLRLQTGVQITSFEAIAAGFLDYTPRGEEHRRFAYAHFRLPSVLDSTLVEAAIDQLTLFAVGAEATIDGTPVRVFLRRDGSPADPDIARSLRAAGYPRLDADGKLREDSANVVRLFSGNELTELEPPQGVQEIFPVGFLVRRLGAPTDGRFDGIVTLAFALPLLDVPEENPSDVSVLLAAFARAAPDEN